MHRTVGDSYGVQDGKNIFREESPGNHDATQFTHDMANALQEEIANVITGFGGSLNTAAETVAQMVQLRDRISAKISESVESGWARISSLKAGAYQFSAVSTGDENFSLPAQDGINTTTIMSLTGCVKSGLMSYMAPSGNDSGSSFDFYPIFEVGAPYRLSGFRVFGRTGTPSIGDSFRFVVWYL